MEEGRGGTLEGMRMRPSVTCTSPADASTAR